MEDLTASRIHRGFGGAMGIRGAGTPLTHLR